MNVERTKKDIFLDYMLQAPNEVETQTAREDLKELGFWTKEEIQGAVNKHLDKEVRQFMRQMPKHDEDGNVIERVNVERKTDDGVKQLYLLLPAAQYEDMRYVCHKIAKRAKYCISELGRMLDFASDNLPKKDARRLRREFQGLLAFNEPTQVAVN